MRYADFLARIAGLCVVLAGAALAGRELLGAGPGGVPAVRVTASGELTRPEAAVAVVGAAFVLGGLAVLAGRGRSVAVSVGGAGAVAAVVGVVGGVGPTNAALGVGAAGLALLLAGAGVGDRAAGSE